MPVRSDARTACCYKATKRARKIKAGTRAVVLFFNLFKELFRIKACVMGSVFYETLFHLLSLPFCCSVFFFIRVWVENI